MIVTGMNLKDYLNYIEKNMENQPYLAREKNMIWLSKRISDVYLPGPKGRWILDKIYFWEKGNYLIYFDFGYPKSLTNSDNAAITESDAA